MVKWPTHEAYRIKLPPKVQWQLRTSLAWIFLWPNMNVGIGTVGIGSVGIGTCTPWFRRCRSTVVYTYFQPAGSVYKLLEHIVFRQLYDYLSRADLPSVQSAYRSHHSTEMAVLKVLTDILYAIDDGDLSFLALLNLSAAFNTVDHDILLTRLRVSYSVRVLRWTGYSPTWPTE